jgi:hypothetical protein
MHSDFGVLFSFVQRIGPGIVDPHSLARHGDANDQRAGPRRNRRSALYFKISRTDAETGCEVVSAAFKSKDHCLPGVAQPRCSPNDALQHRLKFEFRAADGAQDLSQS